MRPYLGKQLINNSQDSSITCRMILFTLLIIQSLFLVYSCKITPSMNDEDIRTKAIKHEYQGPVNNVIYSFIEAYYRMPATLEELSDYCRQYRLNHLEDISFINQFIAQMHGEDPSNYFSHNYVSFISFADSCFLYDSKHKYGCCVYGTPCFWANTDYRKARSFSPSVINKDNKIVFNNISYIISREIQRVTDLFENRVLKVESLSLIPDRFLSQSFCLEGKDTTVYNIVLKYSRTNGIEKLCSRKYYNGPLMWSDNKGIVSSLYSETDLDSLSRQYKDSLYHSIEAIALNNDDINEVLFIAPLAF